MIVKPLEVKHVSEAAKSTIDYIQGRRTGEIRSLLTKNEKLNKALMDGVEWNKIFTIAGMSGSGKSTIIEQLKRDFVDCNDNDFDILSFEFEMSAAEQFGRNLSGKLNKSTQWLYSSTQEKLTDADLEKIKEEAKKLAKYPIYSVDNVGTVSEIESTILNFAAKRNLKEQGKGLIITIDHALLTKGNQGEREKEIVDDLAHTLIRIKKHFIAQGIRILIIILSQLNRAIESNIERKTVPLLQYPNATDIFGASSLYHGSDYVLVSHKPALLQLENYGPPRPPAFPNGLPTYNPKDPQQAMIYWHLLKHRGGEPVVMAMIDELKFSKITPFNF